MIDYAHICSKILKSNDLKLKSNSTIQQKQYYNFLKKKHCTRDPEKVIFNFSKYVLSGCEKTLLTKDLNFSIPCKKLGHADYLVNFELFFRDVYNLDILPNEDLDFAKFLRTAFLTEHLRWLLLNVSQNDFKDKFIALQNLSNIKDLIIEKSDKINSLLMFDRQDNMKKLNNILSDQKKFTKVNFKDDTLLNFAINQEKHVQRKTF